MKITKKLLLQIKNSDVEGLLRDYAGITMWAPVIVFWGWLFLRWALESLFRGYYKDSIICIIYISFVIPV